MDTKGFSRYLRVFAVLLVVGGLAVAGGAATSGSSGVTSAALSGKALILDTSVLGGASSEEALKATSLGLTVDVVDATAWAAMTASQFAAYRVIILGDADCSGPGTAAIAAAEANRTVWGPQVDGNIIVNGTDPVFHSSSGGIDMTNSAVAFAADASGKTGLYLSLSCYYHGTAAATPVPVLDPFGTFTVTGVGCYNDAHIVASHPALAGLTDTSISNWSCSVHEAFDAWPKTGAGAFTVLAIARNIGTSYTAPDGSVGTPYVLARGEGLAAGDISLSPATASNPIGTSHTLTALVTSGGTPLAGKTVTFTVLSGPHAGVTGTGVTDADGKATFSYTGTMVGTDTIQASFVDAGSRTQTSNTVTKEWTNGTGSHTLTVNVTGSGTGSVTSDPAGIACPTTCSAGFTTGAMVTLTPTAATGSTFTGWSGACTGTGPCIVTMSADKTVTATFTGQRPPDTAVEVEGEGTIGLRYPVKFELDVERTSSGRVKGDFEFSSKSRHLDFESTAILSLSRSHNTAMFEGMGEINDRGIYHFIVAVVDNHDSKIHPDRISILVTNASNVVVYSSNGLRHVDGDIDID